MADTISPIKNTPPIEHLPQVPIAPERSVEREHVQEVDAQAEQLHIEPTPIVVPTSGAQPAGVAVPVVTTLHRQIERVLEEDLVPLYRELDSAQRVQFRSAGERAAAKIEEIMKRAAVKVGDIIKVIMEWLILLPGVNRFFIEQEAKLKADKILFLKELA